MIASNLNTYTIHNLPQGFWDNWKANKAEMKKQGYSPFKAFGEWYLAIYDGGKATLDEYKKQLADEFEQFKNLVILELQDADQWRAVDDVARATSKEEIRWILEPLCENLVNYIDNVEYNCFINKIEK